MKEGQTIDSDAAHQKGLQGSWHQVRFSNQLWYSDYGGTAHVDVRLRKHRDGVVAFVFMYAAERHLETIEQILRSIE